MTPAKHLSARLRPLAGLLALLLAGPGLAHGEPVRLETVIAAMGPMGAKSMQKGILSGQPLITGEWGGFGFTVGLRFCEPNPDGSPLCEAAAFKTCERLPGPVTPELLKFANAYNLRRYAGTVVVDQESDTTIVLCVTDEVNLRDENLFGSEEVNVWYQAAYDFRSVLDESGLLRQDAAAD